MAYRTKIAEGVVASSTDVRLSRGRTAREHHVYGLPFPARVWEDRTTGTCTVYVNHVEACQRATLRAAYAQIIEIAQEA